MRSDLTEVIATGQAIYAVAGASAGTFRYHRLLLVWVRSIPPSNKESSS